MKFKNLKIRSQLGIAFAVAVIPLIIIAIVPIVMLGSLNDIAQKLVNRYVPMLHTANDLVNNLGKSVASFQDLLNTSMDENSRRNTAEIFSVTRGEFNELQNLVESAPVPPELQAS